MKAMKAMNLVCAAVAMCVATSVWAQNEQPKAPAGPRSFKIQDQQKQKKEQEGKKTQEGPPPGMTEEQWKAVQAYGKVGENHEALYQLIGEWEGAMTCQMAPGAPAIKSTTRASIRKEYDGRFITAHHNGDFEGQPFHGTGVWGYNNLRKQYESTWYDNMGTSVTFMTGKYDTGAKTFTFTGKADDPMAGKPVDQRWVTTIVDSDSWKMEFFSPGPDGKEFKSMEIDYRRQGATPRPVAPAGKKEPAKEPAKTPPGNPK